MSKKSSSIHLPPAPRPTSNAVVAWREPVTIDTYSPDAPSAYPEYLDARVYQGSSGKVYPLPFYEKISGDMHPHRWDAIHLENDHIRLMILPELGGRIHIGLDKTNGYDFFYRNNVIKPALVGLAGPWLSGGVEFNWPQHHRPGTFLPVDTHIEQSDDGSVTVWCSDHDPFARMKGMHGIRLRPNSSLIEVTVRLFNRTDDVQSFLWWANVAVSVNDSYQSFFPTDVHYVADHAKRATTTFPRSRGTYYGVDYSSRVNAENPDADRLDWYRNIPVPTSYMCIGTKDDFFGGYDHGKNAGMVYWADHRVAPGKKQWTWGNAPFGWAWDRQLTDADGPYIELMGGAYTDNQPDFTFLAPGETKVFSQYWYPIHDIGVVHQATTEAAVHLEVNTSRKHAEIGVAVTRPRPRTSLTLRVGDHIIWSACRDLSPSAPLRTTVPLDSNYTATQLTLEVEHQGRRLVTWTPYPNIELDVAPDPVSAMPAPTEVNTADELYLDALHLEQYRHASRSPEPYLEQSLSRDPGDSRAATLLAARRFRAGRYTEAKHLLETAIARVTSRNPNPADGEPHYRLGLVLDALGDSSNAIEAFTKAAWSRAWKSAALLAAARIEARIGNVSTAMAHARNVLAEDGQQLQARSILAILLAQSGHTTQSRQLVAENLALDPLDWWSRDIAGQPLDAEPQTTLDIALEYLSIGATDDALRVFEIAANTPRPSNGLNNVGPVAHYYRYLILRQTGAQDAAAEAWADAHSADMTNCLLGRRSDADAITAVLSLHPEDAQAHALLGHWLYSVGRKNEAVTHWQASIEANPRQVLVHRNLAIAAFTLDQDSAKAAAHYDAALQIEPTDAKLVYESDQLAKRTGTSPKQRAARLARDETLLAKRDDLTIEFCEALTLSGNAAKAIEILKSRHFSPWEGGEGKVIDAWDHAHLWLGLTALGSGQPAEAIMQFREALALPTNLGEERHLLANNSDIWQPLGLAYLHAGDTDQAHIWLNRAAHFDGDFRDMSTTTFSTKTYYSAIATAALGGTGHFDELRSGLEDYAESRAKAKPEVDYFATSLPQMLLFPEDLDGARKLLVSFLRAQICALRGDTDAAVALADTVIASAPNSPEIALWKLSLLKAE